MKKPREKQCSNCLKPLPFETGFYDDKRSKDGKRHQCIPCSDIENKENEARRLAEPMSARAEAMKRLYKKRFKVIRAAGLSIDKEGLTTQNKIDRVLKKHGLFAG